MITSAHYTHLDGKDCISKKKMQMIHNLVNTAKSFLREGKTSHGRAFHCCFGIEHGKVKEIGFNSYKHTIDFLPKYGKIKKFADKTYCMGKHAEVDLILKLGNIDFDKMIFLNIHIDKNFKNRTSKPCLNCLNMMQTVGAKSCWYFDEEKNRFLELKI